MSSLKHDWFTANREYLITNIQHVKACLERLLPPSGGTESRPIKELSEFAPSKKTEPLPALEVLAQMFQLSEFEKMIVTLSAGTEIDGDVASLCSRIYGNPNIKFPTLDIALRAFPDASWKAILPESNLRRFRLISLNTSDGSSLVSSQIRIDERILHYILGYRLSIDSSLQAFVKPVRVSAPIPDSHKILISRIVEFYSIVSRKSGIPIFQLWGKDQPSQILIAKKACEDLGLGLWAVSGDQIPMKSAEEQLFSDILARECFLTGSAVYIDAFDSEDGVKRSILNFVNRSQIPLLFLGVRDFGSLSSDRPQLVIEVKKPTRLEQKKIWKECLSRDHEAIASTQNSYEIALEEMTEKLNLDSSTIEVVSRNFGLFIEHAKTFNRHSLQSIIQDTTNQITRIRLGDLAEKIVPVASLDDIILPKTKKDMIKMISVHFKHRHLVYDEWGFAKKNNRGLGIVALFSGESGTGKTMAAEAVANELGIDLFRIDLSMVANKYIGETEKNFKRIFDAAEAKECVLFFDEADSLFGKRSEVRDSHDRYANMQVGYILQRIESFDGIIILATNFKKNMDSAFIRRIRFIIEFPFPDECSREEIWRRVFPGGVPTRALDFKFLSRLSITGGSIRNIALNAAFLAAEENNSVTMDHVKRAAEDEYAKLGRTMTSAEIGTWPTSPI